MRSGTRRSRKLAGGSMAQQLVQSNLLLLKVLNRYSRRMAPHPMKLKLSLMNYRHTIKPTWRLSCCFQGPLAMWFDVTSFSVL